MNSMGEDISQGHQRAECWAKPDGVRSRRGRQVPRWSLKEGRAPSPELGVESGDDYVSLHRPRLLFPRKEV